MTAQRIRLGIILVACLFLGIAGSAKELPARLSDEAYWKIVTEFSERGGRFPSDNFVSNELRLQRVLSDLAEGRKSKGAYIGVGPEQNFTYIAALQPKIAFIVDIRRQNLIEHLMYKALFELSATRAEFLSRLFSRQLPENLNEETSIDALFDAFRNSEPDAQFFDANLAAIKKRLNEHGFELNTDDETSLGYVFTAFFVGGQNLGYPGPSQAIRPPVFRTLPTYEELMIDSDESGVPRSFLATEENFAIVKEFERNNLIVPLVGNFAGPETLRAVGDYLREHDTRVSAFYLSNVEQYLFMNPDDWKNFYSNVAMLPLDSRSVFIRPLINTGGGGYAASPLFRPGFQWDTLLFSMEDLVAAFNSGMIQTYYDVIQLHN